MNNRVILIIIVIVLVLAIIGVALALFWKSALLNGNTNQAANTNTTANVNAIANTNVAGNTNGAVNQNTNRKVYNAEIYGTNELHKRVAYRGSELPVASVELRSGFSGIGPAPEGMKWVLVKLEHEVLNFAEPIWKWADAEISLVDDAQQTYQVQLAAFAAKELINVDESYLGFQVPKDAKGFTLRLVRSGEDTSLELGL
ncbi:MAG: hypothetical protein HY566_01985 [Candidatus Kerfeldbacteria bacterium]|nr:hypothetical protein [Candidatus Kerfeldbacteria bacterium]